MQTLKDTPHQTIKANAAALDRLATWYAETGAAEALEAGRTNGNEAIAHHAASIRYMSEARELQAKAENLRVYLTLRTAEAQSPAIDRKV